MRDCNIKYVGKRRGEREREREREKEREREREREVGYCIRASADHS